jgi:hypothetical protein
MTSRLGWRATALTLALLGGCSETPADAVGSIGGSSGLATAGDGGAGAPTAAGNGGVPAAAGTNASAGSVMVSGSAGSGGEAMSGNAGSGGSTSAGAAGATFEGSGTMTYERWNDIPGELVELVPVNEPPDVTMEVPKFQAPDDVGQDFSARMRGVLTAPATGDYVFWISSDDNSELNLSSDEDPANKRRIAHVTGSPAWTDYVEWSKFETQKSTPVSLVAGKRYYIEALLKEDIAEDHLAVGWLKPGEAGSAPSEIIPGTQLSPVAP